MNEQLDDEEEELKFYKIYYRMECSMEAYSEEEAMEKYADGEAEDHEYVEFISIEEA